ncbi:hypothetical protein AB0D99_10640 [Streptomyces sp. NPDC047971]|uniref:hypothetical protein n=1 Tax=Streptomyces sp. NPDC047971 TaxID=3154499 RepID=UPI00340C7708
MAIKRCTTSFAAVVDGAPRVVRPGTLVEDGDPILKGREQFFESVDTYMSRRRPETEAATAEPSEKRSLPSRRAAKKTAGKKPAAAAPEPVVETAQGDSTGQDEQQEGTS